MLDIKLIILSVTFLQGGLTKATTEEMTGFQNIHHCEYVKSLIELNHKRYVESVTVDGVVKDETPNLVEIKCVQTQEM